MCRRNHGDVSSIHSGCSVGATRKFGELETVSSILTTLTKSMNKSQKGEFAKLKVEQRAVEKGWIASRTVENSRYDLVLDNGRKLFRVQVKYASACPGHNTKGAVVANLRSGNGDSRNLKYSRLKSRTYTSKEIDAVVVYIPQIEKVCWFGKKHFHKKGHITIRYELPLNKQKTKLCMACDFVW